MNALIVKLVIVKLVIVRLLIAARAPAVVLRHWEEGPVEGTREEVIGSKSFTALLGGICPAPSAEGGVAQAQFPSFIADNRFEAELKAAGSVQHGILHQEYWRFTVKNTLLITASVAALLAGLGLASAQGVSEHREAPAAAASEQKAPAGQMEHQKAATPMKSDKANTGPTAQAPEKAKPGTTAQVPDKATPATAAQAHEKAASPNRETAGQEPSRGASPGAVSHEAAKSGASAPLSPEQHAKIRNSLRGEQSERLANVQFSISIGDAIPGTVHLRRLPVEVVEYAPQYRDYDYILVGDDILIVDPLTHRIVAVIAA